MLVSSAVSGPLHSNPNPLPAVSKIHTYPTQPLNRRQKYLYLPKECPAGQIGTR
ncbi:MULTISPECIES: hypothetical protein [Lactococcus]|uniref:hypothetical protein n=1 Tax=Lactococcus TaxID=1357 RepID=UPI0012FE0A3F|nr:MULTISPECIES: hypothetical protein [Lactococcus]MDM7509294.1 hypothetical protein [Lactococcus lactis]MDM7643163.1 hypothetical protein [Lactococcus lactis]QPS70843.1 hypothetical protein I6G50_09015 [Lactococcus garvieae]